MKKIMFVFALLSVALVTAQENKPVFEEQGDYVKGTFFYDNGNVLQEGTYKDGKLDGKWVMYDVQGNKKAMGFYRAGQKVGKWFFWEEKALTEIDYTDNQIAAVLSWKNAEPVIVSKQ